MLALVPRLSAHATPFTYVDIRVTSGAIQLRLSAHIVDAGHELGLARPESLLDSPPGADANALGARLLSRLHLRIGNQAVACAPVGRVEAVSATQSLHWTYACTASTERDVLTLAGPLFPYDPEHHTFVNVYVDDALRAQGDLTGPVTDRPFQLNTTSAVEIIREFAASGVQHILSGADHLLFLVGLLLPGGSIRRLITIVTAFTIAHSITLAVAVLGMFAPPAAVIEPLIALSIVAVGVDNFRTTTDTDHRALSAGAFGLIHGFGFASVLREMQLRQVDVAWSLASFNAGVELGQLAVVAGVAWLFGQVRRRGPNINRRLIRWGSSLVIAAGACWFVARVWSAL